MASSGLQGPASAAERVSRPTLEQARKRNNDTGRVPAFAVQCVADLAMPPGRAANSQRPAGAAPTTELLYNEASPQACRRCGSLSLRRWGRTPAGRPRLRCRACARTFTSMAHDLLGGVHAPDKFCAVAADMQSAQPRSCRGLGRALGLDKTTVWQWRWKIMQALSTAGVAALVGLVDGAAAGMHSDTRPKTSMDRQEDSIRTVLRESRKASREWVRHRHDPKRHPAPDRLRWIDYRREHLPLPVPMTLYLIPIHLTLESASDADPQPAAVRRGIAVFNTAVSARPSAKRPRGEGAPTPRKAGRVEATPSAPCALGPHAPTDDRREGSNVTSAAAPRDASAPERLRDTFVAFIRLFRGPASQYLAGYLAWFAARRQALETFGMA